MPLPFDKLKLTIKRYPVFVMTRYSALETRQDELNFLKMNYYVNWIKLAIANIVIRATEGKKK